MIWYNINSIRSYVGDSAFIVTGITAAYMLSLTTVIPRPYNILSDTLNSFDYGVLKISNVDKLDYSNTKCIDGMYVTDELTTLINMINNNVCIEAICEVLDTLTTCNRFMYSLDYIESKISPYLKNNNYSFNFYRELVEDYED